MKRLSRVLPWLVGACVAVGLGLWLLGAPWGLLLVALGLGLFVLAAWLGSNPQGIRVPDPDPIWFGDRVKIEPPPEERGREREEPLPRLSYGSRANGPVSELPPEKRN
jgi:hypothetical protein